MDTEQPDYDLDSEDDTFVNKLNKKMQITALQFEEMIDRLEKGSGQQVSVSLQVGKNMLALIHFWFCSVLFRFVTVTLALSDFP